MERRRFDEPLLIALVALLCWGWFLVRLLATRDDDVSRFVLAGAAVDAKLVPPGLTVRSDIGGYDGVAFYRLAVDPRTDTRTAYGITLDAPAYRQQRIFYPLLAHVLSFGHVRWIPALLVAINVAALVILAGAGASIARQLGLHSAWGAMLSFYPGFVTSLSRDVSEIVACTLAVAAVWAIQARRFIPATLFLACAVLTRETVLLVVLAVVAISLLGAAASRSPRVPWLVPLVPLGVFGAWQIALLVRWGVLPLRSFPGAGITIGDYFTLLAKSSSLRNLARLYFSEGLYFGLLAMIVIIVWRSSRSRPEWRLAWIGFCVLMTMLPHDAWNDDAAFMRHFSEFSIFSMLIILGAGRAPRIAACAITGMLWIYAATHMIRYG